MQINADQLARQLERGLAPLYLVSGDEPLQSDECSMAIRRRAETAGCHERSVFTAGPGFDWDGLRTATQSLSLFAERRLIELRLPTGRPGEAGAALLAELTENPSADIVLLVRCVFNSDGTGTVGGDCNLCYTDTNCSGGLSASDIVLVISATFNQTPFPC